MSPVTHFLTGWVFANCARLDRRERALVTVAVAHPVSATILDGDDSDLARTMGTERCGQHAPHRRAVAGELGARLAARIFPARDGFD